MKLKKGSKVLFKKNSKLFLTYKDGHPPKRVVENQVWFVDADLGNGWINVNTWKPYPGAFCSNVHKKFIKKVM